MSVGKIFKIKKSKNVRTSFHRQRTEGTVVVEVINAMGTVVTTRRTASLQGITAPNEPGVYTLRVTVNGTETGIHKLLVR